MVGARKKRLILTRMREKFPGLSIRSACKVVGLQQSSFHYKKNSKRDDTALQEKLLELAQKHPDDGRPAMVWRLRTRLGWADNHKRIGRVYRELSLQIGKRKRKKSRTERRFLFLAPRKPNELWAMDFVMDAFADGRRFRVLTVKDLFTHEAVLLYVDRSIPGSMVARELDRVCRARGFPEAIICDNGSEFVSKAMDQWAFDKNVKLNFIRPGKPIENAFIESFNGKLRVSCLNQHWFMSLEHARQVIEDWRHTYNTDRPNRPLGTLTPAEFAMRHGVKYS